MEYVMVEYTIKKGEEETAREAIIDFLEAIKANEPDTRYEIFSTEDGDYLHMIVFQNKEAEEKHQNAEYTLNFVDALYPLCEQRPLFTRINPVE